MACPTRCLLTSVLVSCFMVTEMTDAVGHAVRATYFYTAMTDLAMLTGDGAYRAAVDRIWANAVNRKHYITVGVGASHQGEAFAADYDLRNDGYCESCAGCGMTFWADRMFRLHASTHPIDVQERTPYHNVLGAIELSGQNFFYQNPLSSQGARYFWHACPCCAGNIPRALLGLKYLMYALDSAKDVLYINHFVASKASMRLISPGSIHARNTLDARQNVKPATVPIEKDEQTVHFSLPPISCGIVKIRCRK